MTEAYLAGFRKTAEAYGVDPDLLVKTAFWPAVAGLAALGTGAYGLYRAYKDFKNYKPTSRGGFDIQKARTDMKGVPGLGSVQAYGNALRQRSENEWARVGKLGK